jgi:hypothetical protein
VKGPISLDDRSGEPAVGPFDYKLIVFQRQSAAKKSSRVKGAILPERGFSARPANILTG